MTHCFQEIRTEDKQAYIRSNTCPVPWHPRGSKTSPNRDHRKVTSCKKTGKGFEKFIWHGPWTYGRPSVDGKEHRGGDRNANVCTFINTQIQDTF